MDEYLRDLVNGPNGQFASVLLGIDAEENESVPPPRRYKLVQSSSVYVGHPHRAYEDSSDVIKIGTLRECLDELHRIVGYEGAEYIGTLRAKSTDDTRKDWAISRV